MDIFDQIKAVIEEMESDLSLRDTTSWIDVQDRYEENKTKLEDLFEQIP